MEIIRSEWYWEMGWWDRTYRYKVEKKKGRLTQVGGSWKPCTFTEKESMKLVNNPDYLSVRTVKMHLNWPGESNRSKRNSLWNPFLTHDKVSILLLPRDLHVTT